MTGGCLCNGWGSVQGSRALRSLAQLELLRRLHGHPPRLGQVPGMSRDPSVAPSGQCVWMGEGAARPQRKPAICRNPPHSALRGAPWCDALPRQSAPPRLPECIPLASEPIRRQRGRVLPSSICLLAFFCSPGRTRFAVRLLLWEAVPCPKALASWSPASGPGGGRRAEHTETPEAFCEEISRGVGST